MHVSGTQPLFCKAVVKKEFVLQFMLSVPLFIDDTKKKLVNFVIFALSFLLLNSALMHILIG